MPYRETDATRRRAEERRSSLLTAARALVARHGFAGAKVSAIADAAGTSTGLVYSYFDNRDELLATVFRESASHELAMTRHATTTSGPDVAGRLEAFIRTFAGRALRGRQLAWALLFEPVSPLVEAERLVYRRAYIDIAEHLVRDGIDTGAFAPQHPGVSGAATIGAISESLIGRLNPLGHDSLDGLPDETIVDDIVLYCHRALGASVIEPKETSR
ncbi:TetR/AcrR family transcriptional regulator [Aeromicrobium sp. YIM 150415]|uniref:TetR/AcrR family transcriptional regulator n=1 Tax=Aeromicrobium sp. YIM 150415 TaxID=2803912 RepID=UPI0019638FB7|nr:TetR/AcrR family transcriptional regulator [Aeromicrobium sp. YIM 150415]MBM9462932.1 TetR/AcrR family transcriptional regulator [Aeromicrobium sp. YIM 150415]